MSTVKTSQRDCLDGSVPKIPVKESVRNGHQNVRMPYGCAPSKGTKLKLERVGLQEAGLTNEFHLKKQPLTLDRAGNSDGCFNGRVFHHNSCSFGGQASIHKNCYFFARNYQANKFVFQKIQAGLCAEAAGLESEGSLPPLQREMQQKGQRSCGPRCPHPVRRDEGAGIPAGERPRRSSQLLVPGIPILGGAVESSSTGRAARHPASEARRPDRAPRPPGKLCNLQARPLSLRAHPAFGPAQHREDTARAGNPAPQGRGTQDPRAAQEEARRDASEEGTGENPQDQGQ